MSIFTQSIGHFYFGVIMACLLMIIISDGLFVDCVTSFRNDQSDNVIYFINMVADLKNMLYLL